MSPDAPRLADGLVPSLGMRSATALVVGTVIGVGIFTSTGFQAEALPHPGLMLLLWVVGGVLSVCGALCYAELGAAMPEAGGEYVYLRESFGPRIAFASAAISLVAGFSAPIAAVLKSFVRYLSHFLPALAEGPRVAFLSVEDLLAAALTWLLVAIHLRGLRGGMRFHDAVTALKVLGIVMLLLAAAAFGHGDTEHWTRVAPRFAPMTLPDRLGAFATSLVFVMFCYSGYNASCYVASEVRDPQRVLPRSILAGIALVVALYLGLNLFYLYGADVDALAGNVEVALVAARRVFGEPGAGAVAFILLFGLLSAASAMTVAGPRVYFALGRDVPRLGALARVHGRSRVPAVALVGQGIVTTGIILTGTVDQIQQYATIATTLFACLVAAGLMILRRRRPDLPRPFRAWGYPATPLLFLAGCAWMLVWNVRERPVESALALATVGAAMALGSLARR